MTPHTRDGTRENGGEHDIRRREHEDDARHAKKKSSLQGPALFELPAAQGASQGYGTVHGVPPPSRGEGRNKPHFVKDMKMRQSGEMAPMKMEVLMLPKSPRQGMTGIAKGVPAKQQYKQVR